MEEITDPTVTSCQKCLTTFRNLAELTHHLQNNHKPVPVTVFEGISPFLLPAPYRGLYNPPQEIATIDRGNSISKEFDLF